MQQRIGNLPGFARRRCETLRRRDAGTGVRSIGDRPLFDDPRAALVAERDRLRADVAAGIVAPGPMTYGSQAAAATQVFEQQRDLALRDRNGRHLAEIEAAIARLDDGTYGACQRCGQQIAPARLEALAWAAFCIDCQRIVGRGG